MYVCAHASYLYKTENSSLYINKTTIRIIMKRPTVLLRLSVAAESKGRSSGIFCIWRGSFVSVAALFWLGISTRSRVCVCAWYIPPHETLVSTKEGDATKTLCDWVGFQSTLCHLTERTHSIFDGDICAQLFQHLTSARCYLFFILRRDGGPPQVIKEQQQRALYYRCHDHHTYPHLWRCDFFRKQTFDFSLLTFTAI